LFALHDRGEILSIVRFPVDMSGNTGTRSAGSFENCSAENARFRGNAGLRY